MMFPVDVCTNQMGAASSIGPKFPSYHPFPKRLSGLGIGAASESHPAKERSNMTSVEFVDRYSGMGRRPSPLTSCKGGCEAIGVHPMRFEEWEERYLVEGDAPHICHQVDESGHLEPFPPTEEDAWVFVYCSTCGGTGRRVSGRLGRVLDKLYRLYYAAWFPFWAIRQTEGHGIRKLPWWFRHIWRETRYWG